MPISTLLIACFGGALEFYDFIVFAVFVPYFGPVFFPGSEPVTMLLKSYGIFAVGYLSRPIGALLFGHLSDRYGRKKPFMWSILLMAFSVICMGLLPGFSHWGLWATVAFVALRFLQGLTLGGELPTAIVYVIEHMPNRKSLISALLMACVNTGLILANGVHNLLQRLLSASQFIQYGWRIAFLLGGVLAIASYFCRSSLKESPIFLNQQHKTETCPAVTIIKQYPMALIAGTLLTCLGATIVTIVFVYSSSYLISIFHLPATKVIGYNTIALMVLSATLIATGWMADHLKQRLAFLLLSALCLAGVCFPAFAFLPIFPLLMLCVLGLVGGIFLIYPTVLYTLFPVRVRVSGVALCYNLGFSVCGGCSPALATWFVNIGYVVTGPALVLGGVVVLGLIGLAMVYGLRLDAED